MILKVCQEQILSPWEIWVTSYIALHCIRVSIKATFFTRLSSIKMCISKSRKLQLSSDSQIEILGYATEKMTTMTNSTMRKANKMIKEIQIVYRAHRHNNSSCILTTLPASHQISEILRKCNNLQRHNSIIWYGNMLTTDDKEFQHYLVVYCF